MQHPRTEHFAAAKRILRYLKGNMDYGLTFTNGNFLLLGFSDADWEGSIEDKRSTGGYCVFLDNPTKYKSLVGDL